jgi:hypothetical protein
MINRNNFLSQVQNEGRKLFSQIFYCDVKIAQPKDLPIIFVFMSNFIFFKWITTQEIPSEFKDYLDGFDKFLTVAQHESSSYIIQFPKSCIDDNIKERVSKGVPESEIKLFSSEDQEADQLDKAVIFTDFTFSPTHFAVKPSDIKEKIIVHSFKGRLAKQGALDSEYSRYCVHGRYRSNVVTKDGMTSYELSLESVFDSIMIRIMARISISGGQHPIRSVID